MIETRATVLSNTPEGQNYWRLCISLASSLRPRPGQFAMLRLSEQLEPLLRRAFVFYRVKESGTGTECQFIYKIAGRGTQQLRRARPGDMIDFLGPLGRGFRSDTLTPSVGDVFLVSGGVGLPALYLLAEELTNRSIRVKLFHGETTARPEMELAVLSDFISLLGRDAIVCTTEDGSFGRQGLVTQPLEDELRQPDGRPAQIFACGPTAMLREVTRLSREFQVPAEVSVEAAMGCGFGVCLGCVVPVRDRGGNRVVFKRACIEGPVFSADDLVWESPPVDTA